MDFLEISYILLQCDIDDDGSNQGRSLKISSNMGMVVVRLVLMAVRYLGLMSCRNSIRSGSIIIYLRKGE